MHDQTIPAIPPRSRRRPGALTAALALAMSMAVGLAACSSTAPTSSGATTTAAQGNTQTTTAADVQARQAAIADGADPARTDAYGTEWLCRPGLADNPCLSDETAAVLPASGSPHLQNASPAKDAPIDCFYIYPTVSDETTPAANLQIQATEIATAEAQASRFSQVCKVYAPMYPQLTVDALLNPSAGLRTDLDKAYAVVQAAWKDYLAHDNHGRGVVVIGHSQGSAMAQQLLKTQFDNQPAVRRLLVSAIVPGGNVVVPVGKTVGGTFDHLPLCTRASQLHCIVAYSSFDATPPSGTLFGVPGTGVSLLAVSPAPTQGMQVACVNPAKLSATTSGVLEPYFRPAELPTAGGAGATTSTTLPSAPWVSEPDLYSGSCQYQNGVSWLQVDAPIHAGDTRPVVAPTLGAAWGLHLDDVNLFLGNLVGLVAQQEKAFAASGS